MQEAVRLTCIFGCAGERDELAHYILCSPLSQIAGAAKGVGMKPVKGATYKTASGKTVTFTGKDFVDKAGKKIKGAAATQLMKGITSGAVTSADPVKMNKMKIKEGDSYKILKQIEDNSVDLIIADPPYNIDSYSYLNDNLISILNPDGILCIEMKKKEVSRPPKAFANVFMTFHEVSETF